jgi:FkbM family methyltransferase
MDQFRRLRPRDTNIEAGVTFAPQELTFHVFKEQGLNTFDEHLAAQHMDNGRLLVKTLVIATVPLVELLDQYVPHNTQIDLLTIDVEGLDYDVLRSNDWDRYSPAFVLVECLDILTLDSVGSNIVTQFLSERHYSSVAKTAHTVLYKRMLSCEEINRQSGGAETMTSHERSGT